MMTSYQIPLSEKKRRISRSIYRAQKSLAKALAEAKEETGLTQQALAKKLGVDRSVVNRRVTGRANLTLRSMAELAWALGRDLDVGFPRRLEKSHVKTEWEQLPAVLEMEAIRLSRSRLEADIVEVIRSSRSSFEPINDNYYEAEHIGAQEAA
jgi:transcriptional regulator with XRE-family HTH domain